MHCSGTLLEQRSIAQAQHDHIRKALIFEPRGHREMYGAVLRPNTELVESGEAHIGVLFLTNEGYSTMCGHATLAVARLLVDQNGELISLTGKKQLEVDWNRKEVGVSLHVPCGLVHVTVPIVGIDDGSNGYRTDPTRPISYLSVPSYATGIWVTVRIPPHLAWPELGDRDSVVVDIAYGGAFYIIASPAALGFPSSLAKPNIAGLSVATKRLKEAFNSIEQLRKFYLQPVEHPDLQFLYGTIVTDTHLGAPELDTGGAETGLCFFSNSQIDRSPTGSGVQAKVALAMAKGRRKLNEKWTYHSIVSNNFSANDAAHPVPVVNGVTAASSESFALVSDEEIALAQQVDGEMVVTEKLKESDITTTNADDRKDSPICDTPSALIDPTPPSGSHSDPVPQSTPAKSFNAETSSRIEGAFTGEAVQEVSVGGKQAVIVKVSGWARYTGASTFVVEKGDKIGGGFWFDGMGLEG